jgi:diguanylate cyclase (GGDEF)-like protein/PAS domain S-box-containing protein
VSTRPRLARGQRLPAKTEIALRGSAHQSIAGGHRRRPREQDLLRATFNTTHDLVVGCDANGIITSMNPAMRRFTGLTSDGPLPAACALLQTACTANGKSAAGEHALLTRCLAGEAPLPDLEVSLESAAGFRRTMVASGERLVSSAGVLLGAIEVLRDITDQRDSEALALFQAGHDPLTHLPNRAHFARRVKVALRRASRHHRSTAVLALNLDDFSLMSNRLGKDGGEQVLAEVARRLIATLRPHDSVASAVDTATRLGGDQFLLLCEDITDAEAAESVALRVDEALRVPMTMDGAVLTITAGVGITLTADPHHDPEALIFEAETAMHAAKREGAGRHQLFAPEMGAQLQSRMDNADALRQALARGEFRVVYQPKVSLLTDRITGVEALLRWHDPIRGVIPPLDFIPLAEASGLIVPIGRWVLEQVCRDAKRWSNVLAGGLPLTVAVNVSPRQFEPGLAEIFGAIMADGGIDPASLCVEVTESMVMRDAELAIGTLRKLKSLGMRISIDDFGTGFSSLAYLKRFPLDELKIDKSFVDGIGIDPDSTAIVAAVMGMAHALGLHVVAEGVETADQLNRLRTLGCDEVQGYYFARPSTPDAIDALLAVGTAGAPGWQGGVPATASAAAVRQVLVVDDAPDVRQLLRSSLAAVGFEVQEAGSGEAAITLARQLRPDCIVLDINLPGISGLEVCRILREDAANEPTTIVMLTVDAERAEKIEAFSVDADDYMVKPFSPRDIVSRVTASMRRRSAMLAARSR